MRPGHRESARPAASRLGLLGLLSLVSFSACAAPEPTPKVLVIGIDGVRPDVLAEVATPNLDVLAAEGFFTPRARTRPPTVSGPGWSSMLTGVWADKHGVMDNTFVGARYDAYPDFLTRLERLRPELRTFAVADWTPLVRGTDSTAATLSDAIDVKHVLDGYDLGWDAADARSVDLAVAELASGDPDALFVYLGNPDEVSHQTGGIGAPYREALREADAQVGRLVAAVRARPTYEDEDWLIISSTDHGRRADGGHGGDSEEERTIYLLVSGPAAQRGGADASAFIVDVAATALAHLGVDPAAAGDLDGRPVGLRRLTCCSSGAGGR